MIYLDHAAATPMSRKVRAAMEPYLSERFFNPSAAYWPAHEVAEEYAAAKETIAHAIGAKGADLVMTGSATEANNLAFSAVSTDGEVLCLATEHDSVRKVAEARFRQGRGDAEEARRGSGETGQSAEGSDETGQSAEGSDERAWEIRVLRNGVIDLTDLRRKIGPRTELISVALANNELGTIQPLGEIAQVVREVRRERLAAGSKRPLYLHSDASQALNLLEVSVARLGVDLLTLNAAKVYGPKGVGALLVGHGVPVRALTQGGGQENGLRSGTENVAGVIGFATAISEARRLAAAHRKKYAEWRRILLAELQGYELVNRKRALDNFVVLCYNGIDAERLLYLLEEKGVYVATGAACAASKGVKSHVLAAIGLSDSEIAGSLRLTLGETNTTEQVHTAAREINAAVEKERARVAGERAKDVDASEGLKGEGEGLEGEGEGLEGEGEGLEDLEDGKRGRGDE